MKSSEADRITLLLTLKTMAADANGRWPHRLSGIDRKFYASDGSFKPVHFISDCCVEVCVPICGFGRPQTDVDVLVGRDGCFLTVLECHKEETYALKKNAQNWDSQNDQRFTTLYGPLSSPKYRYDMWLAEKAHFQSESAKN